MLLVDAHVHIHDCFDLDALFDAAFENFRAEIERSGRQSGSAFLLLTEGGKQDRFNGLRQGGNTPRNWRALATGEPISLRLVGEGRPGLNMFLVAGRQIVTAEGLEVLALLSGGTFEDGRPLGETVSAVRKTGGLPVLPWGVGKWMGRRGRLLKSYLQDTPRAVFLGDNGGRPVFWPRSRVFRLAAERKTRILPGSDPLPLAFEYRRVGNFGLRIDAELAGRTAPAAALKQVLLSNAPSQEYGKGDPLISFCRKQLALRTGGRKKRFCIGT